MYERSKTQFQEIYSSVCVHLSNASTKKTHGTTKLIDYIVDESFIFEIFQIEHVRSFEDLKVSLIARRQGQGGGGWKKDEGNFLVRGIKKSERYLCADSPYSFNLDLSRISRVVPSFKALSIRKETANLLNPRVPIQDSSFDSCLAISKVSQSIIYLNSLEFSFRNFSKTITLDNNAALFAERNVAKIRANSSRVLKRGTRVRSSFSSPPREISSLFFTRFE